MQLTALTLREVVNYDPDTGDLTWAKKISRKVVVGSKAGALREGNGYRRVIVGILGKRIYAHRLAWAHWYGEWPAEEIDHINGDAADNRIANLRLATKTQNRANSKVYKNNRCGVKGVHEHCGRWRVQIRTGGKSRHVGVFDSKDEAAAAYLSAAREVFGEYATDGKRG